ncbi:hypothetical protein [Thalassotalea fusca]
MARYKVRIRPGSDMKELGFKSDFETKIDVNDNENIADEAAMVWYNHLEFNESAPNSEDFYRAILTCSFEWREI